MDNRDEFYIGWQRETSPALAGFVKGAVLAISMLALVIGFTIAISQRKFSSATFESEKVARIKGVYQDWPVPSILVQPDGNPQNEKACVTIPLVGLGKHGAENLIKRLKEKYHGTLNNKLVVAEGNLLYYDGKTFLQAGDTGGYSLRLVNEGEPSWFSHSTTELGTLEVKGEILDPKCYFGAMKPGMGKPHKDCAVRCIEGGMSPVFCMRNEKGETSYGLLLGADGGPVGHLLKDFIGDPVSIHAKAVRYDDWILLYSNPLTDIKRISGLSIVKTPTEILDCAK